MNAGLGHVPMNTLRGQARRKRRRRKGRKTIRGSCSNGGACEREANAMPIGCKVWMIVNMSDNNIRIFGDHSRIDSADGRPSYIHHTKDSAERELLRLSKENNFEYYLFESIATARDQITGTGLIEIVPIE